MIEWLKLTSAEIGMLDRNIPLLMPMGLIEAHGPHMPVSVDIDSCQFFAKECAKRTKVVLMPVINYGFSDEMREYPGSVGLSVETFMNVISDVCKSLCKQEFKKIIFLTGHGANKAPCELAFYKVWELFPDFKGICWNWWSDCGIEGIHHADKGETEVAMSIGTTVYKERIVDYKIIKPWYKIRSRFDINKESGGINGEPSRADYNNGIKLRDRVIAALIDKINMAIND